MATDGKCFSALERGTSVTLRCVFFRRLLVEFEMVLSHHSQNRESGTGPDQPQITDMQRANLLAHEVSLVPCDHESD